MTDYAIRPDFEDWVHSHGRSRRSVVRFNRQRAAYDMAARKDERPTVDDVHKAYGLLGRCIRYALADMRMDETETEHNCNSPYRLHRQELLEKRHERLQSELDEYGCVLHRPWCCYDVFVKAADGGTYVSGPGYLYFF